MWVVMLMIVDFAEIDKKGIDFVFWDSHSRVLDHNVKTDEAHFSQIAFKLFTPLIWIS